MIKRSGCWRWCKERAAGCRTHRSSPKSHHAMYRTTALNEILHHTPSTFRGPTSPTGNPNSTAHTKSFLHDLKTLSSATKLLHAAKEHSILRNNMSCSSFWKKKSHHHNATGPIHVANITKTHYSVCVPVTYTCTPIEHTRFWTLISSTVILIEHLHMEIPIISLQTTCIAFLN